MYLELAAIILVIAIVLTDQEKIKNPMNIGLPNIRNKIKLCTREACQFRLLAHTLL